MNHRRFVPTREDWGVSVNWSDLSGARVLVTGAAGGVGAFLIPLLLSGGAEVVALDDLSSGRWENLGTAAAVVDRLEVDVQDGERLAIEVPWGRIDLVVHLAAISSLPACESDPARAFRVNVQGTIAVCDLARVHGVEYVLNASTSAIYERTVALPFRETAAVEPVLVYPQTKWAAERYVASLSERYGMSVGSLRFFNLFGPFQDFRRQSPPLLNYLVRQIVRGEVALLHSDGHQRRDYVSVEAACRAIGLLLCGRPLGSGCWNVCSGQALSVREIVAVVNRALGVEAEVTYRDARLLWDSYTTLFDSPRPLAYRVVEEETEKSSLGDPGALRDATGWVPDTSVPDAIGRVALEVAAHIRRADGTAPNA